MYTHEEIERLAAVSAARSSPFRPLANYDARYDSLEFIASDENFYGQDIDEFVTVYFGQETNEVVGVLFKKLRKHLKEFLQTSPGLRTEIHDHRIKVEHLFTATIWSSIGGSDEARILTYKKLRELARANDVEAEIDDLAQLVA